MSLKKPKWISEENNMSIPTKKDIENEMKENKKFIQDNIEKLTHIELKLIKQTIITCGTLKFAYDYPKDRIE